MADRAKPFFFNESVHDDCDTEKWVASKLFAQILIKLKKKVGSTDNLYHNIRIKVEPTF